MDIVKVALPAIYWSKVSMGFDYFEGRYQK